MDLKIKSSHLFFSAFLFIFISPTIRGLLLLAVNVCVYVYKSQPNKHAVQIFLPDEKFHKSKEKQIKKNIFLSSVFSLELFFI